MTFKLPESLSYQGVNIVLADQDESRIQNAIDYLLNYGFGKSLQDSVAGVKKEMTAAGSSPAEIATAIAEEMASRAEAIFAGTVGTRGTRLTGPDAIKRTVIDEFFRAWGKSQSDKGKALPSLKSMFGTTAKVATEEQKKAVADALSALRARYAEVNSAKIEEETARRVALQEAQLGVEIDLGLDLADADGEDEGEGEE